MRKNVAGQSVGAEMITASDGSAFAGAVSVFVTLDAGTQAAGTVGGGACTHEGNGYHTYLPSQAETNGELVAFTFTGTGAIPRTVQIYTAPADVVADLRAQMDDSLNTYGPLAPIVPGRLIDVDAIGQVSVGNLDVNALEDIADAILKRDFSLVTGEAARSLLNAARFLRNKWSVSAGTLTVTKEDDTTTAWTGTTTGLAGADPITGVDPA